MASRIPNTYRRSGIYYARFRVPKALHPHARRVSFPTDIRISLNTYNPDDARLKIIKLSKYFYENIDKIKTGISILKDDEVENIFNQITGFINERELSMPVPAREISHESNFDKTNKSVLNTRKKRLDSIHKKSNTADLVTRLSRHLETVNKAIYEQLESGYRIYSDADDPLQAADEIAALQAALRRMDGSNGGNLGGTKGLTLAQALTEYLTLMTKGRWKKPATASQSITRLNKVVAFIGADKDVSQIKLDDIERFETDIVSRIDINSSRRGRKKTDDTLAVNTAKAYIFLAKNFFRWCYKKRYTRENLSDFLGDLINSTTPRKKRLNPYPPFTNDDIKKIFGRYLYNNEDLKSCRKVLDSYFWAPLLGLFAGMRLNEICQLKVEDIQQEDGIWFINSDDLSEGQSSKNEASKRRIPLHDELIRIGFLTFWQERKQADGTAAMLFRGLKWDAKNQWIKQTSRWFVGDSGTKGHLDLIGLRIRDKKVFHSFRHTVVNRLRKLGVPATDIAAVVGHEPGLTTEHYGGEYELGTLKQIIDRLQYPVDLSHIHYEQFRLFQLADGKPNDRAHIVEMRLRKMAGASRSISPHAPVRH